MKIQSTRSRLLASSMICGAAALAMAAPAMAQDQAAADTEVEALVVTGSRIPQPNLTSTSPLSVVTDQEAKLQGTTNVENLLNNLPQVFAEFGSNSSNGATGQATVNLRNLSSVRTLVLVDGKRLMPSDPRFPVADLNNIPAALVDRVEVVSGGASAVYGSDAIAGVVNFIMKKDFEGVRLDAQYGFFQHHQHNDEIRTPLKNALGGAGIPVPDDFIGGDSFDITGVVGVNTPDGKGNVTIYAGYRHLDAVTQDNFDYTACTIATGGALNDTHTCAGSSNFARATNLITGKSFFIGGEEIVPYGGAAAGHTFNFAPFNYLQRPDARYVLGGFGHYEISPMFDVYLDTMFADDHTLAQIAPSGLFQGSGTNNGAVNVNCDNPLLNEGQRNALCAGVDPGGEAVLFVGRRNVEGGPRIDDLRHTSYRIVMGSRGELGAGWRYDVFGQYGLTLFSENYSHEFSKARTQNALRVVTDTREGSPTFGQPVCTSVINGFDPTCVPLDIFSGLGGITDRMLQYVEAQGFQSGYTEEQVVSLNLTGDLGQYGMKFPWATDGVGIALGAEYRREGLKLDTSRDFQINDLYGQGGATLPVPLATFDVKEVFGEVRIPLVQDAPFFRTLQLEAGFRYSDYSSVGSVESWKIAGEWAPIDDVRFRASFQRAVRAPNVLEAFSPNNNVLFGFNDPCGSAMQFTVEQCANTGLDPALYGSAVLDCPSSQCKHIVGGNPNLSPEESDTKSFGVVFTPTFFRGFTASVDFFDITVEKTISVLGASFIFNSCATTGNAFFCDLITRDAFGTIYSDASRIEDVNRNTGFLKTRGVDMDVNYRTSFEDMGMGAWGTIGLNFIGTWTDSLLVQPVGEEVPGGGDATNYDCAGFFGVVCGTPIPEWRHKLRVTWGTPWDVQLSVNWRYFSSVDLDVNACADYATIAACTAAVGVERANLAANTYGAGVNDRIDATIPSFSYIDLAATWTVRDGTTLRFGVNNVFDKDPPIVDSNSFAISSPPFGNGNTYPQVYDSLGRTFFVGITADF